MLITVNKNDAKSKRITLDAETIVDGMKIGIIKSKLKAKGIPIKLGMGTNTDKLSITIDQLDLIDLLC